MQRLCLYLLLFFNITLLAVDYADRGNWVFCESDPAGAEQIFDVFYIYPTVVTDKNKPLMDWSDPKVAEKTAGIVQAQAGLWGKRGRIFAPFVRQLEYSRVIVDAAKIPWDNTGIKDGIMDTAAAFDYYMKHYNSGRPFILFGHSQGAIDLYSLLKNNPGISVKTGLVAAYLIGLPNMSASRFEKDFAGRDIKFASGEHEPGRVIIWNTQSPEAVNPLFSGKDALCINPLNWRTDDTPASAKENRGALFYDYRDGKYEFIPAFCGARIDPAKGALIVDLPHDSPWHQNKMMGEGVYHVYDVYFFAINLRENALLRLENYLKNTVK